MTFSNFHCGKKQKVLSPDDFKFIYALSKGLNEDEI